MIVYYLLFVVDKQDRNLTKNTTGAICFLSSAIYQAINYFYSRFADTLYKFIYHISIGAYTLGIRVAALWNKKAKKWILGRKVFPKIPGNDYNSEKVWMHCASLGEFEQGRPVIEKIKTLYPSVKIIVTFFSPSGYEIRKDYPGADYIFYLPKDSAANARKFIDNINPTLVLWIKYEYWFYYLKELKKRNIPTLLVSGIFRKEQAFFKWYGNIWRQMLDYFSHFFIQTEKSKKLLQSLNISKNVTISGDTRFDRVITVAENFEPIKEIESFIANTQVVVAGSTWTEDDEELDHYANTHPEVSFIIAPHEISNDRLSECLKLYKNSILYSQWVKEYKKWKGEHAHSPLAHINCIIIDNIGMLNRLYYYADVCYIGGGFGEDGIHNTLEAAVYGKPIIFGPVYEKHVEAIELVGSDAASTVSCALELEKILNKLLTNAALLQEKGEIARKYVQSKAGATNQIINYIEENLLLTK